MGIQLDISLEKVGHTLDVCHLDRGEEGYQ